MSINTIKNHIESLNGKFFTVKFVKKNGETRILNGRTNVRKYLHGGANKNSNPNHIVVFDVQAMDYRTVNLENIVEMHTQHKVYTF